MGERSPLLKRRAEETEGPSLVDREEPTEFARNIQLRIPLPQLKAESNHTDLIGLRDALTFDLWPSELRPAKGGVLCFAALQRAALEQDTPASGGCFFLAC